MKECSTMVSSKLHFFALSTLNRTIILTVSLLMSLTVFINISFADSVTVNGTLDTGDISVGSCAYKDVFEFTVTETGTYSIPTFSPALNLAKDNFFVVFVTLSSGPAVSADIILGRNNDTSVFDEDGILSVGTTYYLHVRGSNDCGNTLYPLDYSFTLSGLGDIICPICNPVVVDEDNIPLPAFSDGRINDYDSAAPIAIYPHEIDGETGLIIYSANGVQLLIISPQQIADAPDNPNSNTLILEANGVSVYRLAGGGWQINAPQYNGKTYVMIFPELFHSGGYDSFELDA